MEGLLDLSWRFAGLRDWWWLLGLVTKSGTWKDLEGLYGLALGGTIVVGPDDTVLVEWCLGLGLEAKAGTVGEEPDLKPGLGSRSQPPVCPVRPGV